MKMKKSTASFVDQNLAEGLLVKMLAALQSGFTLTVLD